MRKPPDLERWFRRHRGRTLNKWQNYLEIYQRHFEPYRGRDLTVVEIGVNHGGSLQMWRDFFGSRATIHGVDINDSCRELAEPGTYIHIGDQGDPSFLESLKERIPVMDIVIDDGGHTMAQQRVTFDVLYPHVADDGLFIVEDLNTSYRSSFGGGYRHPDSFIEHTKTLIDDLHAWHSETDQLKPTAFTTSAFAIHIYRGMVVVEKRRIDEPFSMKSGAAVVSRSRRLVETFPQPVVRWAERMRRAAKRRQ